jgi:hypothetical protein
MSEHEHHVYEQHTGAPPVDELWIRDWAAEGISALERYLVKQAAFAAFLAARGVLDSGRGDAATS